MYFDDTQTIPVVGETIHGYTLERVLDNTKNSVVYVSKNNRTKESVAIKFIKCTKANRQRVEDEISLMEKLQSPFVISGKDFFDYPPFKCVVMPLAVGDLHFLSNQTKEHKLPENTVKQAIKSALNGLKYLHSKNICHRDIKPDNFFIYDEKETNETIFQLGDLGYASELKEGQKFSDYLGTLNYAAPEVITGTPYDESVDIWSLGVSMFTLLSGFPPFPTNPECTLRKCITTGAYYFPQRNWKDISKDAKDLISHMIKVDPKERWNPDQCLEHKWFANSMIVSKSFSGIRSLSNIAPHSF